MTTVAVTPLQMADAVLAVLSGTPAETAAATINTPVTQLIDAVEAYQAAGYQALETCTAERGWYSVYVQFTDWDTAEQAASTVLAPRMDRLNQRGLRTDWWFIRKRPYWRLRIRPLQGTTLDQVTPVVNDTLDDLATSKVIARWRPVIYEPETAAFGGPLGTEIAHELFCTDSRLILSHLRYLPESGIGRKELSMLLCGTLLGAAGLDRFERGDVWHRVAELRPLPAATPPGRLQAMAAKIRPLVATPIDRLSPTGPCAFASSWTAAFRNAGRAFGNAASAGHLYRGVRRILTHLVIFHWNRLGLSATSQAVLSRAAHEALLPTDGDVGGT